MTVQYRHEIPMGHRLKDHKGKCRFLHGHNYVVDVSCRGPIQENGMVIDFSDLKRIVRSILDIYDHAFVLEDGDNILREVNQERIIYMTGPPTAENLASLWKGSIESILHQEFSDQLRISVAVEETQACRVVCA